MVERTVARKRQQPGHEGAPHVILAGVAPELQENVLHHLFRGGTLPQYAQHEGIDNARVPLVQFFESAHVSAKKLLHQRRVWRHLFAALGWKSRQEHVYASSSPRKLYVKFVSVDVQERSSKGARESPRPLHMRRVSAPAVPGGRADTSHTPRTHVTSHWPGAIRIKTPPRNAKYLPGCSRATHPPQAHTRCLPTPVQKRHSRRGAKRPLHPQASPIPNVLR